MQLGILLICQLYLRILIGVQDQIFACDFTVQGILNGIKVTDSGKALVTNISGTLHTVAHEELVSGPMAVMQEHQII
jgi:hypothetical protein